MFDSPRNERSFQTFEAPTRSIFAQKSNDARKKRQSMQISHNSIGTRKLHDFPARTNSNTNANYTLSSPKVLDPKRIPGFKINFDSEDAYDGTITKEDSLRSSNDLPMNRIFNKSVRYQKGPMVNDFIQTPKPVEHNLQTHFSYDIPSVDKNSDGEMKSINSGSSNKQLTLKEKLRIQQQKSGRNLAKIQSNSRGGSHKSKKSEDDGPLLPIRPESRKRLRNRKNSKLRKTSKAY